MSAKYHIKDRVLCRVNGVTFTGTIEQCGPSGDSFIYHVEADVQGETRTAPLFVQEDEVLEQIEIKYEHTL